VVHLHDVSFSVSTDVNRPNMIRPKSAQTRTKVQRRGKCEGPTRPAIGTSLVFPGRQVVRFSFEASQLGTFLLENTFKSDWLTKKRA